MDKVIVIVGPTGVGKTKLSIELAKSLNGEIINGDSTQIFRGLDIATAKVREEEKENIPHHLIDIRDIEEDYNVFDYQKDCRAKIDEIFKKGKTPIIVGGTGLYIKAALYDYKFEEEEKEVLTFDNPYEELLKVDPTTIIHPNNTKRILRALEYYNNNKKPLSEKENTNKLLYDAIFICLDLDRDTLYKRINDRVDIMMKNGLLEEAKRVFDSKIRTKAIETPIGYKELFPYFEGRESLEHCIDQIKQKCRKYAKRQETWNKHQWNVKKFTVDINNFTNTVNEVLEHINQERS